MNLLGSVVPWRCLATDHDSPRDKRCTGISLDSVVEGDDVKNIQELSFVLVNTFNLDTDECVIKGHYRSFPGKPGTIVGTFTLTSLPLRR